MASIERTAYPRFKTKFTIHELKTLYTPTSEEISLARARTQDGSTYLSFVLFVKTFKYLGYFPVLSDVPESVVNYVKACLKLPDAVGLPSHAQKTLYRQHQAIRVYLEIQPYDRQAQQIAENSVYQAAQIMDNPADLINVMIEELIRRRYELPAFSTLDDLAQHIRTEVNATFFQQVITRLNDAERQRLDRLITLDDNREWTEFIVIKQPPKSATLSHMRDLETHLKWLQSIVNVEPLLEGIPPAKIKHFAAEAMALETYDLKKVSSPKQYTLLLCLLYKAQIATRDHLVDMFLKRMSFIHRRGKDELDLIRKQQQATTERLVELLAQITQQATDIPDDTILGQEVRHLLLVEGGPEKLREACEAISAYNGNNYLPLLWRFYRQHRQLLFALVQTLDIRSTSQDQSLITALHFLLEHQHRHRDWLPAQIELDFASQQWQHTVVARHEGEYRLNRRRLEVCIFSYLASELKSGDLCVQGSEQYADLREQMLPWAQCESLVARYCEQLGFEPSPEGFVKQLQAALTQAAQAVDRIYPENGQLVIQANGELTLKRLARRQKPFGAVALSKILPLRMPERRVLDALRNAHHWTNWSRTWGPVSGSDPKLKEPILVYILSTFGYGCNLGPAQTARHTRGLVTARTMSTVNTQHVTGPKLDTANVDIINHYNRFDLPKFWGGGLTAAADGTQFDLNASSLLAERHIRYGGYGGIAYHHISDTYIALFSHFIACGVWEAVYILDGLLKNKSDIQPDTLHADTQGQSTPVFGLSYLLGIKLMPRIRNWQDLTLYRPDKRTTYQHIDSLFSDVVNWELIRIHWQDLLQVVLSIQAGVLLPSTLFRKLSTYSRKNRLYQAFRELGHVIRTIFLLQYISDAPLRQQITATTNKVEAYHNFSKWLFFGGQGTITANAHEEQEKRIKYNDLVANAVILQNVADMTALLHQLADEGYIVNRETVATLSPYLTAHIKRFGDYVLDLDTTPDPPETDLPFSP